VAGADASGVRFPVIVNPDAWEDELPRQERQGFSVGEWEEVPENVPRDLASTCAWVVSD
jgi:hypothetical protein